MFLTQLKLLASTANLDAAIDYLKETAHERSGEWLSLNPKVEAEIRRELTDVWTKNIYRMIAVEDKADLDVDDLGIYWTYTKDKARAYWGSGKHLAFITARVRNQDIDWIETVTCYLRIKTSGEDEVRLLEKAKPEILSIDWLR